MPLFQPFNPAACALCGSLAPPSGEHKIKASSLREQFGDLPMVIARKGEKPRPARGPKSKQFHFSVPFCLPCNNHRTQDADREWDRFRRAALEVAAEGLEPVVAFDAERYVPVASQNTKAYLNVMRYFSKLMSAHLAESSAPRSQRLTRFALGVSDDCPIYAGIVRDATYQEHAQVHGAHPYAAHGGLVLLSDEASKDITGFHTAVSLGALQCTITYRLNPEEFHELSSKHSGFASWCRERASEAVETPVTSEALIKLGLKRPAPGLAE